PVSCSRRSRRGGRKKTDGEPNAGSTPPNPPWRWVGPRNGADVMAEQDRPQLPAPVFILCPIRSFSSVACAMLGQHPELYAFPELRLFNADTVEGVMRFFERVLGDTAPELEDPREVVLVRHVRFFADRRRQGLAVPPALPEGLLRALAELQF